MVGLAVSRTVAPTIRDSGPSLRSDPSRSSSGNSSPVSCDICSRKARTVSVRVSGKVWLPSRATASATLVTALSSCRNEPCPGLPRAFSRIQAMPFSAVSIR